MADNILEVRNLKKYFKTPKGMLHAVDDVSFSIERGKTLGIVGESGCGKSTTGRCILRLIEPTSGEILFDGEAISKKSNREMKKLRQKMQIIFQDPFSSLDPSKTVLQAIGEPLRAHNLFGNRVDVEKRVLELMETVGLAERLINSYPHELDGGRRQRIGIARALAMNPSFIVCDEPVSALDVSIQAQILNLLMDIQDERNLAYMFITHDLSVVKHISDDIMVMYLGQCIEKCETNELFNHPIHPYTQALLDALPVPDLSMRTKQINVIKGEITSPINPKPGCRFAARCPFATEQCRSEQPPYEEVSPGHFVACFEKKS